MIFKKKKIQSQQFTESDIEKTFQELDRLNEKFLKNISKNLLTNGTDASIIDNRLRRDTKFLSVPKQRMITYETITEKEI